MLNKEEIIALYESETNYKGTVIGSAAMVLHGLQKECYDLDIAIPRSTMNDHLDIGDPPLLSQEDEIHFIELEYVEYIWIRSVPVATLRQLMTFSQMLKRDPTDIERISRIHQYLYPETWDCVNVMQR